MTTIVCPQCQKDDMIQKVSAIYRSGVSTTSYEQPVAVQTKDGTFYGSVDKTAVNITALASRLAPPVKPEEPDVSNGCAVILLIVGVIAGVSIASAIGGGDILMGVFGLGAPVILFYLLFKFYLNPRQKEYNEKIRPVWDRKLQEWNALYYCSRDDCVFNPAQETASEPKGR